MIPHIHKQKKCMFSIILVIGQKTLTTFGQKSPPWRRWVASPYSSFLPWFSLHGSGETTAKPAMYLGIDVFNMRCLHELQQKTRYLNKIYLKISKVDFVKTLLSWTSFGIIFPGGPWRLCSSGGSDTSRLSSCVWIAPGCWSRVEAAKGWCLTANNELSN